MKIAWYWLPIRAIVLVPLIVVARIGDAAETTLWWLESRLR